MKDENLTDQKPGKEVQGRVPAGRKVAVLRIDQDQTIRLDKNRLVIGSVESADVRIT